MVGDNRAQLVGGRGKDGKGERRGRGKEGMGKGVGAEGRVKGRERRDG